MAKIHIDEATVEELNYAVAVAQEFDVYLEDGKVMLRWNDVFSEHYHPTTSQAQCFDLILKFKVSCTWNQESGDSSPNYLNQWYCTAQDSVFYDYNESLNIAVIKAILLHVFKGELIETA